MKVLVTGSNGQLGSEIKAIHDQFNSHQFTFVDVDEMDLSDQESILDYFSKNQFDLIINCAAYTDVDGAEEAVDLANKINGKAPGIIAQYCAETNCRLIHISTDYVFEGNFYRPIHEEDNPNPVSIYGKTKLDGEKSILKHLDNAYIIRTSWVYSKVGKNFVKTMLRLGSNKEEINVVCDQVGTPTFAGDLAMAIMQIINNLKEADHPGIYHYSNEGVCSWYDFAIEIMSLAQLNCKVNPIPSSEFPTKATRPYYSVLNKEKLKKKFNLEIPHWKYSLKRIIAQMP